MQVQVAEEEAAVVAWTVTVPTPLVESLPAISLLSAHIPGIDMLRGVAVLLVVLFHGMAYQAPDLLWGSRIADLAYGLTAWGWLGVNLFFVISGFLITGILDDTSRRKNFYRRFYVRRALRILPAYVAVLALAWATGFVTPNYIGVCLLFLANMPGLLLHHGYLFYGPLWSLAVEEQFYLMWPALYRKLGRPGMLVLSLSLVALCPLLRALAFMHLIHTGDPLSKTWMVADNLALGALLAVLLRLPGVTVRHVAALGWTFLLVGSAGLAALFHLDRMGTADVLRNSVGLTCFLLLCGAAVVAALCVFRSPTPSPALRLFVFFGEISYCLYLVHLLLLQIYDRAFGTGFKTDWRLLLLRFAAANGLAVALAVASRRWFERPILRLKQSIAAAR
jgi:peptidoglycan/LPS O-acetylase OafA/YrhL